VLVPAVALYRVLRVRRAFSTAAEQATYNVLHRANEAAPPFRAGLTTAAAAKSIRVLHQLLGSSAVALTNETDLLAWDGVADHHGLQASLLADPGGLLVHDAALQPQHLGPCGYGVCRDLGRGLGSAEHVDHIHGHVARDVAERGIRPLAQDVGLVRVDRDDPVSLLLEVARDAVRGPLGVR